MLMQRRLSKMFLYHNATYRIGSSPTVEGTFLPLIAASCFPAKKGSWHGLASLPCNCTHWQITRLILLSREIFTAMVCSRLSLYRLLSSAKPYTLNTFKLQFLLFICSYTSLHRFGMVVMHLFCSVNGSTLS